MGVSDPIADMICVINNAIRMKKSEIIVPSSGIKKQILNLLLSEGFISFIDEIEKDKKRTLKVGLKYTEAGSSVITNIVRVSTPGKREYVPKGQIEKVKNGFGISILSTNKGIVTGKQARINNVGGEVLCEVW